MKIIFFCLFVISIASCRRCETCTTVTTTTVSKATPGYPQTTNSTFQACGSDIKEVDGQVITATSSMNGISATTTSKTTCN